MSDHEPKDLDDAKGRLHNKPLDKDSWEELREWTDARIALGRAGTALPTRAVVEFQLDHARARDAVGLPWRSADLESALGEMGLPFAEVRSRAETRDEYLRRPDLGRLLHPDSEAYLSAEVFPDVAKDARICIVVADGLSSLAVERQAAPMLHALVPALLKAGYALTPVVLARQARVALIDEIAPRLGAAVGIMFVGERPGLSSPDSLGIYLTFDPRRGRQNAERNCISNVRPAGLSFEEAARRCLNLVKGALLLGESGIGLKEDSIDFFKM